MKKHSISRRIGLYFLIMIACAGLISSLSLAIMSSNQSDAALINVSGSLRMQSYRFIYEMEHHPEQIPAKLEEYQRSLNSPELLQLEQQWIVPASIAARYQELKQNWQTMAAFLRSGDTQAYVRNIERYADHVNAFVLLLQQFVEFKLQIALWVIISSMVLIISLAGFGIWYVRHRIISPLNQLVTASVQVQNEDFNHIALSVNDPNELGTLSAAFTQMASELAKLYASLEQEVENKTRRLTAVNRSLLVLYRCSQLLTAKPISKELLTQVLQNLLNNEHLNGIEIHIYGAEYWNVSIDNAPNQDWQTSEIAIEDEKLAQLRWKPSLLCPDLRLLQSVSEMIGRSLYVMQVQKQQQQLVLMEERAIIARELHDSLAQSMTFFKIQVSLLKRNSQTGQDWQKQLAILCDFEKALNEAYRQLRELLATFRLTIQEANLTQALESVIDSLKSQTTARLRLQCKLPSNIFNAQQQVHVLQIVREALINAIKHSQATQIEVIAETNVDGEHYVMVRDNGVGIADFIEPEGHYGLTIMKERACQLHAEFQIHNRPEGGVEVMLLLPNIMSSK